MTEPECGLCAARKARKALPIMSQGGGAVILEYIPARRWSSKNLGIVTALGLKTPSHQTYWDRQTALVRNRV